MSLRLLLFILAAVMVMIWMVKPHRESTTQATPSSIEVPVADSPPRDRTVASVRAPARSSPPPSPTPLAQAPSPPIREGMPKLDEIREEIARDPHSPPLSGLRFTIMIAQRMQKAQGSEEESRKLFAEVEDCARNEDPASSVPSLQAVCLQTAREIVERYPGLQNRFDEMMAKAEPEAAAIAREVR